MISVIKKLTLKTRGMECHSCEQRIGAALRRLDGVRSIRSDYSTETTTVEYDTNKTDENAIIKAIEDCGYRVGEESNSFGRFGTFTVALGIFAILAGAYLLFGRSVNLDFTDISMETGFATLLVLGFLTGFHCIGMCGGFVLSYSGKIRKSTELMPHLLYGSGKTISYTAIGALFGLVGSLISFTPELRGGIALLAGGFLVIYGLNMLNIFPVLRKLQLKLPSVIPGGERKQRGPLMTGLLNGFMIACGPLQALYIFAAGTGSAISGAQALFFFGLGTLFPLLTFGIASRFLSSALTHNVVKFSGVLVILLGLAMANNGLNLLGVAVLPAGEHDETSNTQINITLTEDDYQVIRMEVNAYGWEPDSFVLKKGVPVRWEIDATQLNGCNNEIIVPEYGLDIMLRDGLQTVEFTPEEEGVFRWSCWMGMIPGQFVVTDNVEAYSADAISQGADETTEALGIPKLPAVSGCDGSCGGGCGGGCGCGG